MKKSSNIKEKYIPKRSLSHKDLLKQKSMILKSRRLYKKGKYYNRSKLRSFKSKVSPHIKKAMKVYHVEKILPNKELSRKTKFSKKN